MGELTTLNSEPTDKDCGSDKHWTSVYTPRSTARAFDLEGLWKYRYLIIQSVRRDLRLAFSQTLAGSTWMFLQPLLTSLIYVFVFSVVARVTIEGVPPFLYIFSGVTLWMFFSDCTLTTAYTFINNGALFSKVYFPRLCMPIASVITALCNFGFRLLPLIAFQIYYVIKGDIAPSIAHVPLVAPAIFGVGAIGMALGLFVASVGTRYRDMLLALSPMLQFAMFVTPVLYQMTMLPEAFRGYIRLNPMASYIEWFRYGLLGIGEPNWKFFAFWIVVSIICLLGAMVIFSRAEKKIMDSV